MMLSNVLYAKKKYPVQKYLFISMISLGVMLFMYNNQKMTKSSGSFGFGELLLITSLILDGFTGGIQEDLRDRFVPTYTLMLHMNMWSVLFIGLCSLLTKELFGFLYFAGRHPVILPLILAFGVLSASGQVFLFRLITSFGPLTLSIVTTCRKFFTVLISIILFGHAMSSRQWLGTVLVFSGIFCDHFFGKSSRNRDKLKASRKGDDVAS